MTAIRESETENRQLLTANGARPDKLDTGDRKS